MAMATAGRLRGMRRLMVRAVEAAFEEKVPKIDLPALAHAFEKVIYVNCPPKRNPFRADFDGHPLIRANEPKAAYVPLVTLARHNGVPAKLSLKWARSQGMKLATGPLIDGGRHYFVEAGTAMVELNSCDC